MRFCDGVSRTSKVVFRDLPERGHKLAVGEILDPSGLDVKSEEMPSVELAMPAEKVALLGEFVRTGHFEAETGALFELRPEPLDPFFLEDVFEAGVPAVFPVAEIAVDGDYGLGRVHDLVRGDETDDIGDARVGLGVAVAHAQAAAGQEVVAVKLIAFSDRDKAEAVGEERRCRCSGGMAKAILNLRGR